MKFFENQKLARQNTNLLIVLFIISVLTLSAFLTITVEFCIFKQTSYKSYLQSSQTTSETMTIDLKKELSNPRVRKIFLFFILFFAGVSIFRTIALSDGNEIAIALGGKRVDPSTQDLKLKRLINIVNEMSIASGLKIPGIYVLPDSGINAFAAGRDLNHAVVGVTEGSLNHLNRDELQAILGHEFSHILNDDMALNMNLAGAIFGLVLISRFGEIMSGSYKRGLLNKRSFGLGIFGLLVYIYGLIGVFLARWIQTLISHQREFLADASAAQFTRNPEALASALSKIYFSAGSVISSPKRMDLSHLFFANTESFSWYSLFSSHPPITQRVKKLLPTISDNNLLDRMSQLAGPPLKDEAQNAKQAQANNKRNSTSDSDSKLNSNNESSNNWAGKAFQKKFGVLSFRHLEDINLTLSQLPPSFELALSNEFSTLMILDLLIQLERNPLNRNPMDILKANLSENSDSNTVDPSKKQWKNELQNQEELLNFLKSNPKNIMIVLQLVLSKVRYWPSEKKLQLANELTLKIVEDKKISAYERVLLLLIFDSLTLKEKLSKLNRGSSSPKEIQKAAAHICTFIFALSDEGNLVDDKEFEEIRKKAALQINCPFDYFQLGNFNELQDSLALLSSSSEKYKAHFIEILWSLVQENNSSSKEEKHSSSQNWKIEVLRALCLLLRLPIPTVLNY